MNIFAFNGSALNGVGTQLIQAAANFVCSAEVAVSAVRNVLPEAAISASAGFVATTTHIQAAAAQPTGAASIAATARHTQAGAAIFDTSAGIVASVRREVQGAVDFLCTAQMIVIPASTLGAANITGAASVVAAGTKQQQGYAGATCTADISAAAKVTRFVSAAVAGSAQFRTEAKVNNQLDGFADFRVTVNFTMPDTGIVRRMVEASVVGSAVVTPTVAYLHTSTAAQVTAGAEFEATATTTAITGAYVRTCAADIAAEPTRTVMPAVSATIECSATAQADVTHAGAAELMTGSCEIVANVRRNVPTGFDLLCQAEVEAVSTVIRGAETDTSSGGSADIAADPYILCSAEVTEQATAEIIVLPTVFRQASAAPAGSASMALDCVVIQFARVTGDESAASVTADATRGVIAHAAVSGSADMVAFGTQEFLAYAEVTAGASIVAAMRSNAESLDPPERTLRRPFENTEMRRPYEITEMRRAA